MKKLFSLLFCLLFLSGCAGFEFNEYEKYTVALSDHSTAESDRIAEQSQSIADIASGTETETKLEGVLLSVIAMQNISDLEPTPLNIERPVTGMEVFKDGVSHIPIVATGGYMWKLGEAGIEAAGNITIGDGVNLNDSLNDTTVHATGSGNTASATQTSDKGVDNSETSATE